MAWVIGPDQMVSRRIVKMGAATGGEVEIVSTGCGRATAS